MKASEPVKKEISEIKEDKKIEEKKIISVDQKKTETQGNDKK